MPVAILTPTAAARRPSTAAQARPCRPRPSLALLPSSQRNAGANQRAILPSRRGGHAIVRASSGEEPPAAGEEPPAGDEAVPKKKGALPKANLYDPAPH
mmetsp:Transcript_17569/g.56646  ORF Transcript_17569/g.56646 Transcript_17569/m.56646 type:complete len:99 (+) Transcript_17569:359-655(+)